MAREAREKRKDPTRLVLSVIMLFEFSACVLLMLKQQPADLNAAILAFALPAAAWITTRLIPKCFPVDRLLLMLMSFLCGLGVIILYSMVPARGIRQAAYYGAGLVILFVSLLIVRYVRFWRALRWPMILAGLALLVLPVLFGRETNGAKNWLAVPLIGSFQPSEVVKLLLLLVLAQGFATGRKWTQLLPSLGFAAACLVLLMLQKDLGTALMYYLVTLLLFYVATSNASLTLAGIGAGAGAALLGYRMFAHVRVRVAIWQNPWADVQSSGYQIVQALMAIGSGGLFGLGLGLGLPRVIPAYHTDFVFAVICEQFGIIFGICVVLVYVLMVLRGIHIALSARTAFLSLLALGCTLLLGLQTFVIIGGVIKLIPLTGITLPFVSYGGTSMFSCMALVGMLCAVDSRNADDVARDMQLTGLKGEGV